MISGVLFESNNNITMSERKLERIHCYSSGRANAGGDGKKGRSEAKDMNV